MCALGEEEEGRGISCNDGVDGGGGNGDGSGGSGGDDFDGNFKWWLL